jgi:hypothetical protein
MPGPTQATNLATSQTKVAGFAPSYHPNLSLGQVPAPTQTYPQMTYPVFSPTTLDQMTVPQSAYHFPFPEDNLFTEDTLSDHSILNDPTLGGFQDLDDLPEDWSTYFWST